MPTAWPTLSRDPSLQTWSLTANTQAHVSPFDGSVQTQGLPGAKWVTTITYANLMASDAAKMAAFLAALGGRAGRITVGNFGQPRPRGTWSGAPLVAGAPAAGATSITTDGWTPSSQLLAGDFFGLGSRLYQVSADATADGSGIMTVTFAPGLRAAVLDNSAVTLVNPTTTMMLVDDSQGWQYAPGGARTFVVDLVEWL
jgi:hypothetical protein